jgi:ATP adenylyltransferase/5',5'''-P-1,P-4-tetraphosphate phosphorylase II
MMNGGEMKNEKPGLLNAAVKALQMEQLRNWPLAAGFYQSLATVKHREFNFGDFRIQVQFNPARIASTTARVDEKSVSERPCFLCKDNLPPEQKGVEAGDFTLLVNPYPIFPEHYTIPYNRHVNQQILPYFPDFLRFAHQLDDYVVLYNGPRFGASAPDHLHFQAVTGNFLPLINEFEKLSKSQSVILKKSADAQLISIRNYLRTVLIIESESREASFQMFEDVYQQLQQDKDEEPGMNLIAQYRNGVYQVFILPRKNFRPAQFYLEDEKRLMISPAVVEMSGILITPVEKHFDKIRREDVEDIYRQISADFI